MGKIGAVILGMVLAGGCADAAWADPSTASASATDHQGAAHELAALAVRRTVETLAHPGGYYLTPRYHIALPTTLDASVKVLSANFSTELANAVERSINHTAEAAAGPAGDFLLRALPGVKLPDPAEGGTDAITSAMRAQLTPTLTDAIRPLVKASIAAPDVQSQIGRMQARYEQLASAPMPAVDLESYTLHQMVETFFASVATEEQNIRLRPSLRTTERLKRLF